MRRDYTDLLWQVLENELPKSVFRKIQKAATTRTAFSNPLLNSHWGSLIDGALKGLEFVALACLDWKLTAIVKLLQSWIKDKREEKEQKERAEQWGANVSTQVPSSGFGDLSSTYY